jgi:protein SCO1/2
VAVQSPIPKPDFTLTDFNGQPFHFVRQTHDKVALLFFGYTHCPDVCPLHMANIAAVLRQMPYEERSRVVTIFVTTDPERDTPQRLRQWLGQFDPSFIGLTGTRQELEAAQKLLGLRPAERQYAAGDSSNYFVAHAAQVFAFARDGYAYLIYPFGLGQEDWAADLPRLVSDPSGASIRKAIAAARAREQQVTAPTPQEGAEVRMGGIYVTEALLAEPPSSSEAALYLAIRNETPFPDTILAVVSDMAARAELHQTQTSGNMQHMMAVGALPLPPRSETRLRPGGTHVMLFDLRRKLARGDSITVLFSLARSGALEARAVVLSYPEIQRRLADSKARERR